VAHAADILSREPFLAESRYRDKLAAGRIRAGDVEVLLREELGDTATQDVAGVASRLDLWLAVILYGIPDAAGHELTWILEETAVPFPPRRAGAGRVRRAAQASPPGRRRGTAVRQRQELALQR
jgi:hypothetical protein